MLGHVCEVVSASDMKNGVVCYYGDGLYVLLNVDAWEVRQVVDSPCEVLGIVSPFAVDEVDAVEHVLKLADVWGCACGKANLCAVELQGCCDLPEVEAKA